MIVSKGYLDVLEAVGQVFAEGLNVRISFAGRWNSENEKAYFFARVNALGLAQVVTHHGPIRDRSRIDTLHREADIFLLPSYYKEEAQPVALIEALSAATPVIVTRHSGIRDMVRQDQEARFVSPRSPESIAEAITELADIDVWRTASRAARERYDQYFGKDVVRAKWLALLSDYVNTG